MREGTIITILYALMWLILFVRLCKNFKDNTTSIFIVSFYLLYSVLAIFLYNNPDFINDYNEVTIFPYIYLFIAILLTLIPILSFDHSHIQGLIRPSMLLVNIITYTFIFMALVSIPSAISELREGIMLLILDSNGGSELYQEAHGNGISSKSLIDIPKYIFSVFSYVCIFIFFYYLTLPKLKKLALGGLTIAMIYNLLRPISMGLRTDTVMTIFAFMAGFIIMRRWIPKNRRKIIMKGGFLVGSLVILLMIFLAISRFTESKGGVVGTNLDYVAQSSLNFNNYGLDAGGIRYGDRTCRIFKEMAGFTGVPNGVMERRQKYHSMKMDDSIFYTFVGDFTLDFGPITTIILFVLYAIIFSRLTKSHKRRISFSKLILLYLAVLIPLQGGMYLFTFSDGGNYSLLAFAFIAFVFNLKRNSKIKSIAWAH